MSRNLFSSLPPTVRSSLYQALMEWRALGKWTDENVRRRSTRLQGLEGAYRGERCFILGNGPSLNRTDLTPLEHEHVWACNRFYLIFDRISWRPQFYIGVDKRVVPDIAPRLNDLHWELPETKFFYPLLFRLNNVLESGDNVYWYTERSPLLSPEMLPGGVFSLDPSRLVYSVFTVTLAALQLAVYLGFNPIYLVGCDTTYARRGSVRREAANRDHLVSQADDDPNHFDPRYFGRGSKYNEPHTARMIFQYHEAALVCESIGVQVFNATVGGSLEEFERVDLKDLF